LLYLMRLAEYEDSSVRRLDRAMKDPFTQHLFPLHSIILDLTR
jgi:hypothetical protein